MEEQTNSLSQLKFETDNGIFLIEEYLPHKMTETQWESFFTLNERRFRESAPDDPLPSRKKKRDYMVADHPLWIIHWWRVLEQESGNFVGLGGSWHESKDCPTFEDNRHLIYFDIYVNQNWRRQGIATAYLKALVEQALADGRELIRIEGATEDTGVPFCIHFGGISVAERHTNRLYLSDLDWNLMKQWRTEGCQRAQGAKIERFEDVPKADLEVYCEFYTSVTNQAPSGDLAGEFKVTPEMRRQVEKETRENGYIWTTLISREPNGEISGMTEISYSLDEPHLVIQEMTGVRDDFRGRGLGKLLKAEMAFFIKDHYPQARFISTGNSDYNKPMLSINTRMGFKPFLKETFFEFKARELMNRVESVRKLRRADYTQPGS